MVETMGVGCSRFCSLGEQAQQEEVKDVEEIEEAKDRTNGA